MRLQSLYVARLLTAFSLTLSACVSGPALPDWQMNAKGAMDRSIAAYLSGNDRVAEREFAKARSELAGTGQATLVARAELLRCASRVASLVLDDCPGFAPLMQDAAAAEQAYARYLAGRVQPAKRQVWSRSWRCRRICGGGTRWVRPTETTAPVSGSMRTRVKEAAVRISSRAIGAGTGP